MSVVNALVEIFQSSGFVSLSWQNWVMILVSFVLLYLAIVKKFEPLLLVPIAFGMLLVNIYPDIMYDPLMMSSYSGQVVEGAHWYDTGVLRLIYAGVKSSIFPCLIFMGVGAMTDFGPLLANPSSLLLGAAAQLGIYVAFLISIATNLIPGFEGFTPQEAASIAIIGGADGPTAIYLTSKLAPQLRQGIPYLQVRLQCSLPGEPLSKSETLLLILISMLKSVPLTPVFRLARMVQAISAVRILHLCVPYPIWLF